MKIEVRDDILTDYAIRIAERKLREDIKHQINNEMDVIKNFDCYVTRLNKLERKVDEIEKRLNTKGKLFKILKGDK